MSILDESHLGDDELRLLAEAFDLVEAMGGCLSSLPARYRHAIRALALAIANYDARRRHETKRVLET